MNSISHRVPVAELDLQLANSLRNWPPTDIARCWTSLSLNTLTGSVFTILLAVQLHISKSNLEEARTGDASLVFVWILPFMWGVLQCAYARSGSICTATLSYTYACVIFIDFSGYGEVHTKQSVRNCSRKNQSWSWLRAKLGRKMRSISLWLYHLSGLRSHSRFCFSLGTWTIAKILSTNVLLSSKSADGVFTRSI